MQRNYVDYLKENGRHTAARRIKNVWRILLLRLAYEEALSASVVLQAVCRGWLARSRLHRAKKSAAVVVIQTKQRSVAARQRRLEVADIRNDTSLRLQQSTGATLLQAKWRACLARRRFVRLEAALVTIQSQWRGVQARQALDKARASAIRNQAVFRGWLVREQNHASLKAALTIQTAWNRHCARAQGREIELRRRTASATKIQSQRRSSLARNRYRLQKLSVTRIQSVWRLWTARRILLSVPGRRASCPSAHPWQMHPRRA